MLKTPHANSMPDVKVKKEWVEGSNVQGIRATATTGAIAKGQRSSKSEPDDCQELEGGVRKNLFEQQRGWQGRGEFVQASRVLSV